MLASTALMLFASAMLSLAQTGSVLTIQTIDVPSTSGDGTFISSIVHGPPIISECIGDVCPSTSTESRCDAVCVREPCFACSSTVGLPSIVTSRTIQLTNLPSDTGIMSVPAGETGSPTPAPSTSGGTSASSTAPTAAQSTGAAPSSHTTADGNAILLAMGLSGLSMMLGFAWTLL
ncbi:hypothetical protein K505DRAFT_376274 [Melanomma pulvis-pyrius CBS 109.77]|uniref:Uncharacterized protein n=1 Tax=Melanomma pulvis-pyrius CBS 109.77 TaxID=1314802 RepID=A0A6A6X7B4_9PLEO|nr:hypothetical protein K505DRAFT_376274 [Melanomma pulvis-pyrius CBS 109.77]